MKELSESELEEIKKTLNTTISNLLFGPTGDPDWNHCAGAAASYKILKMLGLEVNNEYDIREILSSGNISEENFLKTFDCEYFTRLHPDFDNTVFISVEEKLGRKLSREENIRFFRRGGMFKEWFFNNLRLCATAEEAEELFQHGTQPPAMLAEIAERVRLEEEEKSKTLWGMLWGKLKRKL